MFESDSIHPLYQVATTHAYGVDCNVATLHQSTATWGGTHGTSTSHGTHGIFPKATGTCGDNAPNSNDN